MWILVSQTHFQLWFRIDSIIAALSPSVNTKYNTNMCQLQTWWANPPDCLHLLVAASASAPSMSYLEKAPNWFDAFPQNFRFHNLRWQGWMPRACRHQTFEISNGCVPDAPDTPQEFSCLNTHPPYILNGPQMPLTRSIWTDHYIHLNQFCSWRYLFIL